MAVEAVRLHLEFLEDHIPISKVELVWTGFIEKVTKGVLQDRIGVFVNKPSGSPCVDYL